MEYYFKEGGLLHVCAIPIILIYQVDIVVLMEFYPSVDDPEKYTRIIEPRFLNALNKMSDSNTWMRVRKIDVFDKASKVHLVGFKGNKEELEKYLGKKDSKDTSTLL